MLEKFEETRKKILLSSFDHFQPFGVCASILSRDSATRRKRLHGVAEMRRREWVRRIQLARKRRTRRGKNPRDQRQRRHYSRPPADGTHWIITPNY